MCPMVSALWVHGWICSGIDSCRKGLWARCCSSLGLQPCGCWVVPLGLCCCSGGPLDVSQISSVSVSGPGGRSVSHSLLHIFMEKPYIHNCTDTYTHRCLDSGINRYTDVIY
ncbi:hypothetical protein ILYODFUR_027850 [Ilyodon furcidens]|uniref:Secreted protein n=1 Tax=Ilyodon furcidens TaxID=33524 RepID=A0ABV0TBW5_9TELE